MILVRCCLAAASNLCLTMNMIFVARVEELYIAARGRQRYQLSSSNSDIAWSKSLAPTCVRAGVSHRPTAPPLSRFDDQSHHSWKWTCLRIGSVMWCTHWLIMVPITFSSGLVLYASTCIPVLSSSRLSSFVGAAVQSCMVMTQFHLPSKTGINWFRLHFSIRLTELDSSLGCWRGAKRQ